MQRAEHPATAGQPYRYRVTYNSYSKVLDRTFTNVELHRDLDDARLRGLALNWQIEKVEELA